MPSGEGANGDDAHRGRVDAFFCTPPRGSPEDVQGGELREYRPVRSWKRAERSRQPLAVIA
jgi:hypothetical protein